MSTDSSIKFGTDGLIPAVTVEASTGDVLMIGFLNDLALAKTRETGLVHYWSRSRQKLWIKGETSGHLQKVVDIYVNCELNTLKIEVEQLGAVCHDGYPTCYYRKLESDNSLSIIRDRWFDPADVYTTDGLLTVSKRWWGAYRYLADHDLASESSTSAMLRDTSVDTIPRIADELRELAGVIEGSHRHNDLAQDLVLEGSQVCYWLAVTSIKAKLDLDQIRPDRALDLPESEPIPAPAIIARLLASMAETWANTLEADSAPVHETFRLVAIAARSAGIEPISLIASDLKELQTRPYLAEYFTATP